MTTKPRQQTLQQRIEQMVAQHQLWFDDYRTSPDVHLHCSFCESSLLIDYLEFGVMEMNRKLMQFASQHAKCEPRLATKTKDMVLVPVEVKQ